MKWTHYKPIPYEAGEDIGRRGVALSHDGRWLVTTHGWSVNLFDLENPSAPELVYAEKVENIGFPAFSPEDELFCGHKSFDMDTKKWRRRVVPKGSLSKSIREVRWLSDGRMVLSGGWVQVGVCSPDDANYNMDVVSEDKDAGYESRLTLCPDGTAAAIGGEEWLFVFDLKSGKYLKRLPKKKVYGGLYPVWGEAGLFYVDDHPDSLPLPGREIVRITLAERQKKKKFADLRYFDIAENLKVQGLLLGSQGTHLYALYSGSVIGSPALRAILQDRDLDNKERLEEILDESLARSANHILVAWDVESGDILHVEPLESVNHVSDYAISGNQKRIAITGFHEVTILDLDDAG
ncbi:MAG: hypothetical protein EP343_11865 [Deltaproteobacteria bacterium]|nr:MAG: hypothetical protein EP343_11865 [Deltaproteobacteria bacterium]